MAEQFKYSSVLASHMNHLLKIKASAGISALRTKWILKKKADIANASRHHHPHITKSLYQQWRSTLRKNAIREVLRMVSAYNTDVQMRMYMFYPPFAEATQIGFYIIHLYPRANWSHIQCRG